MEIGLEVSGFPRFIAVVYSVEAELWALRDGLILYINLNLLAVELELDANVVLGWVSGSFNSNLHHASLIIDYRTLINLIFQVKMKHCFHEVNKCMDFSRPAQAFSRLKAKFSNGAFMLSLK